MLSFAKGIKTNIGLAALALLTSYLIAKELVSGGYIKTEFLIVLLLAFLAIFAVLSFAFVAISKPQRRLHAIQRSVGAANDQQSSLKKEASGDVVASQSTIGKKNKQKIEIE